MRHVPFKCSDTEVIPNQALRPCYQGRVLQSINSVLYIIVSFSVRQTLKNVTPKHRTQMAALPEKSRCHEAEYLFRYYSLTSTGSAFISTANCASKSLVVAILCMLICRMQSVRSNSALNTGHRAERAACATLLVTSPRSLHGMQCSFSVLVFAF